MKNLIKLEELAEFIFGIFLFSNLNYAWWWFPALILVPDISMIGYLINTKIGAFLYNLVHHKALGILILGIGFGYSNESIQLIGIVFFAHSAMDRFFGYGLKFNDSFKNTHLGKL